MKIGIRDASFNRWALSSSATGIKFRGRSFSESTGEDTDSVMGSSRTGITGDVLGKGTEYGLGSAKFSGIGGLLQGVCFRWGEVTWSKAAWMGVASGDGEHDERGSIIIGRM